MRRKRAAWHRSAAFGKSSGPRAESAGVLDLVFSAKARRDIVALDRYSTEQFGLLQTDTYVEGLEATCELIATQPGMGTRFDAGRRRFAYGSHVIYYRATETRVTILEVRHGRKAPPR